jgi:DNA-binding transcriptional regulator YdaS (Cro superfamily)
MTESAHAANPQDPDTPERALADAKKAAGSGHALARMLKLTPSAVTQWKRVPPGRVLAVEAATNIPKERLRPDLYPPQDMAAGMPDKAA